MAELTNLLDGMSKGRELYIRPKVKQAILDPDKIIREECIEDLKTEYPNLLKGFMGDNQLFLIFKKGNETETAYVCDVPKVQQNRYGQAQNFDTRPKIEPQMPIIFQLNGNDYFIHQSH
jgi:hypothetical protein